MTRNSMMTVGSMLGGGQAMALDLTYGRGLVDMAMPDAMVEAVQSNFAVSGTDIRVERGTRFVELRGVAVMPLRGILTPNTEIFERYLGWSTYQGIEAVCAEVAGREDINALVIDADSPGGLVLGCEGAVAALGSLAAVKPVHVLVNPLAASAAYWLTSQATEISAAPGSMVGSIGIMREAAWYVEPDRDGAQWSVHLSSNARAKYPNPTTERGRDQIQMELDQTEARFLASVAAGRGVSMDDLKVALSATGDAADGGGVWSAQDAAARGLVDLTETRAAFYARVMGKYAPTPKKPAAPARAFHAQAAAAQAAARL